MKQQDVGKHRRAVDQLAVWDVPIMPGLPPVLMGLRPELLEAWRNLREGDKWRN